MGALEDIFDFAEPLPDGSGFADCVFDPEAETDENEPEAPTNPAPLSAAPQAAVQSPGPARERADQD
jgi:hypothetical protein